MGIVVEDVVDLLKHLYHFPNIEYIEHYIEHRAGDRQGNPILLLSHTSLLLLLYSNATEKKELKKTIISSIKNIIK